MPSLSKQTALDYFSQRSNPFYDRTCNNEVIKMQRADPEQLTKMTGIEYMLLHVQEPILFVVRKQHRQTPERVTPLADYYILGGVVYQCPDLWSVINSRMLSALHCVHEAFTEITSYARYDPSKGYSWQFPSDTPSEITKGAGAEHFSEEQRRRVDRLLTDLTHKFPPKAFGKKNGGRPEISDREEDKGALDQPPDAKRNKLA
ncbi:mediator of RNA polymerase II transcription subunit 6-like [Halichondria panicea]|uniref:mediator of RNA polymerase II transcription subunit 6-like n=1 Tax=Halichondria panicea TaxID=6063 RepID=UPI00312BBB1E